MTTTQTRQSSPPSLSKPWHNWPVIYPVLRPFSTNTGSTFVAEDKNAGGCSGTETD